MRNHRVIFVAPGQPVKSLGSNLVLDEARQIADQYAAIAPSRGLVLVYCDAKCVLELAAG